MKLRKLGVGVYVDTERNELHVDIPELLHFAHWDDTPENRDQMTRIAQAAAAKAMPNVPQTVVITEEGTH